MAKGFINITVSGNGDVSYYGREKECLHILSSSKLSRDKTQLVKDWKQIEQVEKSGDKTLGIRGRHDAQVRKNYTLSLPNELSAEVAAQRIQKIVEQTPIKDCTYSIFIHRGAKNGIVNLHAHLIVNERNLDTQKKDRSMIKQAFLEKSFRPLFSAEFLKERQEGKEYESRDRIAETFFHADLGYSQQSIQSLNETKEKELTVGLSSSETDGWNKLFLDYAVLAEQEREDIRLKKEEQQQQEQKKKEEKRGQGFSL